MRERCLTSSLPASPESIRDDREGLAFDCSIAGGGPEHHAQASLHIATFDGIRGLVVLSIVMAHIFAEPKGYSMRWASSRWLTVSP